MLQIIMPLLVKNKISYNFSSRKKCGFLKCKLCQIECLILPSTSLSWGGVGYVAKNFTISYFFWDAWGKIIPEHKHNLLFLLSHCLSSLPCVVRILYHPSCPEAVNAPNIVSNSLGCCSENLEYRSILDTCGGEMEFVVVECVSS